MTHTHDSLAAIRRPRLLIRAARFGLEDYERSRDLKRILRSDVVPAPGRALDRLVEMEAEMDASRQRGDASYSIAAHLDSVIALMAEARLASPQQTRPEPQDATSRRRAVVSLAAR